MTVATDRLYCPVCLIVDDAKFTTVTNRGDGTLEQEAECQQCGARYVDTFTVVSRRMLSGETEDCMGNQLEVA
jgi:hypothetical protein